MFKVEPLPGASFGALITDVDLSKPMDKETARRFIDTFHEHQVIKVPEQELTFEDFDQLTKLFGEQRPHFLDHLRMRGHPAILMLSNILEDGKPIGVFEGAAFWHTDVAYEDPPNSSTVVYAVEVPTTFQSPTQVADMYAAYDALPESTRQTIDDLTAVHHYGNRDDMDEDSPYSAERLTDDQRARVTSVLQPLVRTHGVTGRKALYGVAGSSFGIVGMPDDEAIALLDELKDHALQPQFTGQIDYEAGDLAAWDTYSTLHMAMLQQPAHTDADRRLLWRVSVTGKSPVYEEATAG